MAQTEEIRLRHMLDAARKAISFVQGRSRADLDSDEMLALAVVRLIEVLGEAARQISRTTRERYPQIPWRQIAGTRDRLIHGYFDVDLDIIWEIVTRDLPPLIEALQQIFPQWTPELSFPAAAFLRFFQLTKLPLLNRTTRHWYTETKRFTAASHMGHGEEQCDEAISGVNWRRLLRFARNDSVVNPLCANLVWSDLATHNGLPLLAPHGLD
jgi:uncharacterized protein with HEPN domain